jgi:magnesium chelatase family protein
VDHDPAVSRAVLIAAAGRHHLALTGNPDGCAVLAHRLHTLLPDLDPGQAVTVAGVHAQAGLTRPDPLRPPWQHPAATLEVVDLIGGRHRPGVVTLAHDGLLYLDHIQALHPNAFSALVAVLEARRVLLQTADGQLTRPADLHLVAACPGASRFPAWAARLLDRIDIRTHLDTTTPDPDDSTTTVAQVRAARHAAKTRWLWLGQVVTVNAHATQAALHAALRGTAAQALHLVDHHVAAGALSGRGRLGVLRVALTIADLAGHHLPTVDDMAEALAWRTAT